MINIKPNLIDYNNLLKLNNSSLHAPIINDNIVKIDGFLSFLNIKNANSLTFLFIIVFFILLSLFLYYRYKHRKFKDFDKHQTIIQFISSVDNHLNYNKTSI
jgi:hypothetical protein